MMNTESIKPPANPVRVRCSGQPKLTTVSRIRLGVAKCLIVPLAACALLVACQTSSNTASQPTPSTSAPKKEPGTKLNKDWGSCANRRCDFGK